MDFPVGISLNDKFKTLFTIRRESMIHWIYGYKIAVLILLEKEPLLREAKYNLRAMEQRLIFERKLPDWAKKIRSIIKNKPIPFIENIESAVNLMRMQIRDIETEINVAKAELDEMDRQYNVKSLTYDQIQSLSGEAFASKIAENAAIATWACEHQLPEDVARALFDSQALPTTEQNQFFNLMTEKVVRVEKITMAFFTRQPGISELLIQEVNELKNGGLVR